jgi:hypothetical protein
MPGRARSSSIGVMSKKISVLIPDDGMSSQTHAVFSVGRVDNPTTNGDVSRVRLYPNVDVVMAPRALWTPVHVSALNLPRSPVECSAAKLDFAAGDSVHALRQDSGSKLHKKSASGSYEKLPRSPQILRQRWIIFGEFVVGFTSTHFRTLTLSN